MEGSDVGNGNEEWEVMEFRETHRSFEREGVQVESKGFKTSKRRRGVMVFKFWEIMVFFLGFFIDYVSFLQSRTGN